ncbi:MAG: sulfatase-like hydrolase/transferase, partial [Acidobacteriota bacterium]|nr:sulfatase-like hydrolase/transferase [Acidobacteriota bacterium]
MLRRIAATLVLGPFLMGCGAEDPPPPSTNILVLIADDLGYTDIGAFGGEIRTPNLDTLAASGLRFTSFYTAATCSPTRAMLLSGVDHHRAGLGGMASLMGDDLEGRIGYEGYLNEHVFHLPAVLRDAGYHTSIAGKWHLGQAAEQSPPHRGFDRSFVLLPGAASHFEDAAPVDTLDEIRYRRDGEVVPLPEGFYSTRAYTDELIAYIREANAAGKPFFALGTYTAPHWPLQVPDEFLDLYARDYDDGWEALAERRIAGAKRVGVIPEDAEVPPLPNFARRWSDLSEEERRVEARKMELYAAMVERLDHQIGRLVAELRELGEFDNTLILFFSDNGAAGEDVSRLADNETFL